MRKKDRRKYIADLIKSKSPIESKYLEDIAIFLKNSLEESDRINKLITMLSFFFFDIETLSSILEKLAVTLGQKKDILFRELEIRCAKACSDFENEGLPPFNYAWGLNLVDDKELEKISKKDIKFIERLENLNSKVKKRALNEKN